MLFFIYLFSVRVKPLMYKVLCQGYHDSTESLLVHSILCYSTMLLFGLYNSYFFFRFFVFLIVPVIESLLSVSSIVLSETVK